MSSLKKIQETLNEVDICGLLKMGAPEDEYSPERDVIFGILEDKGTLTIEDLQSTFDYFFAPKKISPEQIKKLFWRLKENEVF